MDGLLCGRVGAVSDTESECGMAEGGVASYIHGTTAPGLDNHFVNSHSCCISTGRVLAAWLMDRAASGFGTKQRLNSRHVCSSYAGRMVRAQLGITDFVTECEALFHNRFRKMSGFQVIC